MNRVLGVLAVFLLLLAPVTARAEDEQAPPAPIEITPLELTMDQSQLVDIDQDAASVIVANPGHVSVSLENPRLLILTPHEAGTTSMIVLDAAGKTILEQDIIVTNVQKKYVRVRRMCGGGDASCNAASYDYCPDGCYDVTPVPAGQGGAPPPPVTPSK